MLDNNAIDKLIIRILLGMALPGPAVGFELLDLIYRKHILGRVRSWARDEGIPLPSLDLCDVWQDTLLSVFNNLTKGLFKPYGELEPYLFVIAVRRACDILRRNKGLGLEQYPPPSPYEPDPLDEVWRLVNEFCDDYVAKHPKRRLDAVVFRTDVDLLLDEFAFPTLAKLTKEVNSKLAAPLTKDAVRGRRYRMRREFSNYLRERGYGD